MEKPPEDGKRNSESLNMDTINMPCSGRREPSTRPTSARPDWMGRELSSLAAQQAKEARLDTELRLMDKEQERMDIFLKWAGSLSAVIFIALLIFLYRWMT